MAKIDPWQEWRDLLRDAAPDPLAVLRLIAKYQRYLSKVEQEAVRVARGLGRSWGEIGEALGVSRQAVWQRYRHRDPASVKDLVEGIPTPQLRIVIQEGDTPQ